MQKILIFIKKGLKFLKNYLLKDPIFLVKYTFYYFNDSYKVCPKFFTESEVIEKIKSGYSYIRHGDGEMALIRGVGIGYQKGDKELAIALKQTIINYNMDSKYILAIPERYITLTNLELKNKNNLNKGVNMFRCWLPFKIAFTQYFPKDMPYADAHSFYISGFFEDNFSEYFKSKKFIIITTEDNIKKQKQNIEKNLKVLSWLVAKSPDPYDYYKKHIAEIDDLLKNENKSDIVLLLGAGPASKPLAYHFSNLGVQSIDVGHGFEYFFKEQGLDHVLV